MTVDEVIGRVEKIKAARGDDELAHSMEDLLHQDVLRAVADGSCEDQVGCAKASLETLKIDFARWYA